MSSSVTSPYHEGEIQVQERVGEVDQGQRITAYPRAGLIFLDFEARRTLQLVGRPEILWEATEDPAQATGGTARYWELTVEQ